jgi:predicted DNA-binding protein
MSTVTVELPDDIAARLAAESEQRHVAPAQFVRETLEKALLELEAKRLFAEMAANAEADQLAGKHDPALVEAATREHRARHPYR